MNNDSSLQIAQTSNNFPPVSSSEYNFILTQAAWSWFSEGAIIAVLAAMLIKTMSKLLSQNPLMEQHFSEKTQLQM